MGDPISYILCGGNSQPIDAPGTVRWPSYVDMALQVGPNLRAAGVKRVLLHNPGGHFYLGWSPTPTNVHDPVPLEAAKKQGVTTLAMWPTQWLLAEQAGLRFADRDKLALGHHILRFYGVEEVIYYVGTPAVLRDATVQGPPCIEMFKACGKGASVGFDALAWTGSRWKEGDDICQFLDATRAGGMKVYVEPRLSKQQIDAGLGKHVDGTIAHAEFDANQKPDLSIQPGETIRDMAVVLTLEAKGPDGAVTAMWRGVNNWTAPTGVVK
jgi:hypothetical protein